MKQRNEDTGNTGACAMPRVGFVLCCLLFPSAVLKGVNYFQLVAPGQLLQLVAPPSSTVQLVN